ncbi:hypothetical protein HY374_00115 [Candidatus Berkelbacteria bacterium]|nr:hypothetical protein [Candidatus Berkelbacteria bacterium]
MKTDRKQVAEKLLVLARLRQTEEQAAGRRRVSLKRSLDLVIDELAQETPQLVSRARFQVRRIFAAMRNRGRP